MDDESRLPAVQAAFMACKREVDAMVAQGMSREAIKAALKRRVMQQRFDVELPADKVAYCLKLVLAWQAKG